jgi:hypothetical protein
MRRLASMFTVFSVMLLLAGCSDGGAVTMPDVVGKRLDVAISDVKRAGFDDKVEIIGGGIFGIVDKSNWTVCTQEPEDGRKISAAPRFTVERTCEAEPTQKRDKSEPDTKAYDYQGPAYEVVSVDANQSAAKLKQFWVYTSALDYSTDAYRDEV